MDKARTTNGFDEIKALFGTRDRQAIETENKQGESNRDDYPRYSDGLG